MSDTAVKQVWDEYYAATSGDTVLKDANFFRMEIAALSKALNSEVERIGRSVSILELGSGTGALAEALLAALPKAAREGTTYQGVDFAADACAKADSRGLSGASFTAQDFLSYLEQETQQFDIIISQRSVMAVIDPDDQRKMLRGMHNRLKPGGKIFLSEGTRQGFERLNYLRAEIGIAPMAPIWHCLYLDEEEVRSEFPDVQFDDYASLYWLITRVIYPFSAEPQHNTRLHDMAAALPQTGDHGLVKLIVASST